MIDPQSYNEAKAEIDQYQQLVARRGLHPVLVIDQWGVPDSIRAKLIELYHDKNHPIEGAVFIGDIPIARVRDAQHMTTAFKMDQDGQFDRTEYTVASDRFYDSFDLEWDFLDHDSLRSEYFYYSLKPESAQKLEPSIYSARILPRDNARGNKYDKLRRYMQRVNQADESPLEDMVYFGGYGYVSESLDARIDEKAEHYDHFPWMRGQQQHIQYIDCKRDPFIKNRITTEVQRPELDLAIFHHHGSPDIQHLSEVPTSGESYDESIAIIKRFLRDQTRRALAHGRDMSSIKASLSNYVGAELTDSWFVGYDDEELTKQDESFSRGGNLYVNEFDSYRPQARMVILDGCYNGSFHQDENIQEGYLFGEDNGTLVATGNSVNVLQDKWVCHYLGLVGLGMRVGNLSKYQAYLEAHVFGDPTFAFKPAADCGFDINQALQHGSESFWRKQLKNEYPAVQIMAMEQLRRSGNNYSDLFFKQFKESESGIVRLAAMLELADYRDDNFVNCLMLAMNDSHEMTQRFAVNMTGDCGDSRLIEPLVELACRNNLPARVEYSVSTQMSLFDSTAVLEAFDRHFPTLSLYNHPDSIGDGIRQWLQKTTTRQISNVKEALLDKGGDTYERKMTLRTVRNYNFHVLVPEFLAYFDEPDEDIVVQKVMMEALGWFTLSCQADQIAEKAKQVAEDERFDASIRQEALRTYNRIR